MKLHIKESLLQAHSQQEEQAIMKEVWKYLSKEQSNALHLYDNDRSGYITMEDLKPKYAYYMADMLAKETANKDNYFNNSVGFWTKVSRKPKGEPDYISGRWKGSSIDTINYVKSGSSYWYTSEGVYRNSDHWGRKIASCSWWINEENPRRTTGFIKWEDLKPKGTLYMMVKELAIDNPNYEHIDFNLIEDNDMVFWIDEFTFEKPRYY